MHWVILKIMRWIYRHVKAVPRASVDILLTKTCTHSSHNSSAVRTEPDHFSLRNASSSMNPQRASVMVPAHPSGTSMFFTYMISVLPATINLIYTTNFLKTAISHDSSVISPMNWDCRILLESSSLSVFDSDMTISPTASWWWYNPGILSPFSVCNSISALNLESAKPSLHINATVFSCGFNPSFAVVWTRATPVLNAWKALEADIASWWCVPFWCLTREECWYSVHPDVNTFFLPCFKHKLHFMPSFGSLTSHLNSVSQSSRNLRGFFDRDAMTMQTMFWK